MSQSEFVVVFPMGEMLSYEHYSRRLPKYGRECDVPELGTHGLRHSTSELYLTHGANRDDIRQFFAHSSQLVTERYIHHRGTNLEKVAQVLTLFPLFPLSGSKRLDSGTGDVLSN